MYKTSTILPSYLGPYEGAAKNREEKFCRAVDSFRVQTHWAKELIIVSDGCEKTATLYERHYKGDHQIKLVRIEKQPLFSGNVRQAGIEAATGDLICYLDSDDYFHAHHLSNIDTRMNERELDWCYYSDEIKVDTKKTIVRNVTLTHGVAGTSAIAHKRELNVSWSGCDGYGHDWMFIKKLIAASKNVEKIYGCGYVVCHTKNGIDL